jgi:tartronate-semialdehyde synthase
MPMMSAMDAALKVLEDEGTEIIFGIPGANINGFYASLAKSSKIRHFISRHEEGAIYAADGYARASGKVGVCAATSGPGGSNFVTGLYSAQADSIPLVAITGQHVRAMQGKEGFQALDITEVARPVCKRTFYVREPGQVPWVFREAFRTAKEGRPGPVLIDLPIDVQRGEIEYDPDIESCLPIQKPGPDFRKIERAVDMLLTAKKPILLIGGGVLSSGACSEFRQLAEHLGIPVVGTGMAKGGFPSSHPLYAGEVGIQANSLAANKVFLDSDLVLGIGCRFADRHTGNLEVYTRGRQFIHIDIDPIQISRIFPSHLGIVSDAKLALQALLEAARIATPSREADERAQRIRDLRKELARRTDYDQIPIKPQRVLGEINEFFDDNTVFVTCIGLNQIWSGQLQRIEKPGHYHHAGGAGPLGWDLPAAIGIKLALPENLVVNITGDFGFQFCMEELAQAVQYSVPVLIVIINNGNMSLIRQSQKFAFNFRHAVDLWYGKDNLVDFVKLAEAFGAYGDRVTEPEAIKPAFRRAMDHAISKLRPAVVDIIVDQDSDCSMGVSLDKIVEYEPLAEAQAVAT